MDNQHKVSVVIPIFNEQRYLRDCLKSLCSQTYRNIEIICVDDGSTDHSIDIIREYQKNDSRIRLIIQENKYAGVARNNGMKASEGEFICFLDADDFFEESMIEEMTESAIQNEADIVLCNARFFNNATKEITEPLHVLNMNYLKKCGPVFSRKDIPGQILTVGFSVPWNKLYRKSFLENNKLFFQNTRRCNDEYFVGMSMAAAERISYVNKRFVTYRINNAASLQGYGDKIISYDFYEAYKALKKGLIERGIYKSLENNFINKVISGCVSLLDKQNNADSFIELYKFIKETVFNEFNMYQVLMENVCSNKEEFENIRKYNAEEYLFCRLKKYQKSHGEKYLFPYDLLGASRKIAIYAAGEVGRSYYRQIVGNDYYSLSGWFDVNYRKFQDKGYPVSDPEKISGTEFEIIVVAIDDEVIYKEIRKFLMDNGVEKEKIVWKGN